MRHSKSNQKITQQKRHVLTIMRAPTEKDAKGQLVGDPTVVARGVLYAYKPLNGTELEIARQIFANARGVVILHIDRRWELTPADWFVRTSGFVPGAEMKIGYIEDVGALGLDTQVVVGEGDVS